MKASQIAAQLYSFRDFIKTPAGVRDTLRRLKAMGYEAVQLSSALPAMPEAELLAMLKEAGLAAPTSHEAAGRIINETEAVIRHHLALGCMHVAYPFPHWFPTGEGETVALARELNAAAEKFKEAGMTLAYHNHNHEFKHFNGRPMLEIIYENAPLVDGEPDTFWVQKGGADPVAWVEKLAGRLQVLHIKDCGVNLANETVMMPIGDGNIDWKGVFAAAETSGVEWYVVEHDANCSDPFDSFARSYGYLKENFIR